MRNANVVKIVACLMLGICARIPATAQTTDSSPDRTDAQVAPSTVAGPVDDEGHSAIPGQTVLRHHLMLPSPAPADPGQTRIKPKLRVAVEPRPNAVKTGIGVVYTCDPNVPTSTCNYLNTTVAGYYNNIFTNANASIYIKFGTTGLGGSDGFINLVHYTPFVTDLSNKAVKSSIQTSALSAINTYATPAYGTQNIVGISVALGTAYGFTGLLGINADETASCTPYTSGCYNEVITVANAASQASGGFSLYYDDQGGTEAANQYDFYAVVQHETDEVLGTSSCISTQNSSGLSDDCDGPVSGSNGIPSVVDLLRYSSPGELALDTTPSTTAGQYYSFDGGVDYGIGGDGNEPKVYNTLDNGDDFADYISSSPDCGTNQAVQDAEGCPGEDAGLTILNDGQSEITILNTDGFDIPEAAISSPTPGSTLSGTSATFTWSAVTGATAYWVYVGTTGVGSSNIFMNSSAITATSQAVTGLPTSGTIYVRIFSFVGGFWTSRDFTYTGGTSSGLTISLSPTSLTFSSTAVGSTTAAQMVTIKNTGTGTVTLTSETITGTNASSFIKSATTCGSTLAASASCTVSVEFKPTASGTLKGDLSIADNATGSPQIATLTGTGTGSGPVVSLSTSSLSFGSVQVGASSASQSMTLTNTGTGALSITSIAVTGTGASSFVFANSCGTSVAAGANCTIHGHFAPTKSGAITAAITITDNASNSPQSVSLSGTGTGASAVSLSTTSLSFGSVQVGASSASQSVTLTNTGTGTLSITSIAVTGTNASSFVFANSCGTSLSAGANCTIHGHFAPTKAGAITAAITITDNAANSPQSISLSGTGTSVGTPAVSLSATSLSFGSVQVGATSASQSVTLTNTGTGTLTVTSITVTGTNASSFGFANSCGTSVAAGANCVIHGHFSPTKAGAITAAITITDNATNSPQSISLSGTGLTPPAVSLSATSLSFGTVKVGATSASQSVTLTNTGTAPLTITSIAVTGTDASSFVFANSCGTSVAGGANCTIHGHFTPASAGALTAAIKITDNASGSPQSIALSGTGN